MFVEQGSHFLILEAFALHDVAPMAGGITDGEKDWLVGLLGGLEGFLAPRVPVHRVMRVLKEVGGFFLD